MGQAEKIAAGSIAIGCLVLALKGAAWWITGSAALYADALESTVNVAASAVALYALNVSARPADANHPYGHEKAEFFSAVVEGALIVVAAVSILQNAYETHQHPPDLATPWRGIALNAVATLVNFVWAALLLRNGKNLRSAALTADGRHVMADVVTSIGVTLGVALAVWTGQLILDPIIAAAVALYVLWSGAAMIQESVSGLMDAAPSPAIVGRIRALVAEHAAGALEAHDLRTRSTGRLTYLEFHLVVPGDMSVADAHDICDRIEAALKAEMDSLVITIHVEPEGKAKHHGVLVL